MSATLPESGSPPDDQAPVDGAGPAADVAEFARAFTGLVREAHRLVPPSSQLAGRVEAHLGVDPSELPSVGQVLPDVERPNLQLALDRIVSEQPEAALVGLSPELVHYPAFSLGALLAGRFSGPGEPVPPAYVQVPSGVDETLRCVASGVWFLSNRSDDGRADGPPVVVGLVPGEPHGPPDQRGLRLEVFAAETETAQAALDRLTELRRELNVYRGQVLGFSHGEYGDFGLRFLERPTVTADEVVLPEGQLSSITRHAIGIGRRAAELTARGQHLRRGLLLYGPPGTGKTHTIGHLLHAMADRTAVVLQGPSVGALGQAAAIVRALAPAMLIIEDVDLIAAERFMGGMEGTNPLMFQLLNEMDGLTPTEDVLFVLTTNRVDVLESALVARPGRIDHAVEIGLPDPVARRRLLELYLAPTGHRVTDLGPVVDRTDGVTASFIKELVRRAVHLTIDGEDEAALHDAVLDDAVLEQALTDLLEGTVPTVRRLLGMADRDRSDGVAGLEGPVG